MYSNSKVAKAVFMGLIFCLFYILYREQFSNGDSLIYADNIIRHRFDDISIHIGYYFIGYIFHIILNFLFSASVDQALVLMSCIMGGIGVIYSYLLSRQLLNIPRLALLSAVILALSGAYIIYSMGAEVYIPQTAFILASMYHFLKKQGILAGLFYAFSLLITTLSIFFAPFFLFFLFARKYPARDFIIFAISSCLFFLPVFAAVYNEYLWGRRGLLRISMAVAYIPFIAILKNIAVTFAKSFHIFIPFILYGYILMFFKNRQVFILYTILNLSHLYLMSKAGGSATMETFLLPIFFTYATMAAFGLKYLLDYIKANQRFKDIATVALIGLFAIASLLLRVGVDRLSDPNLAADNIFQEEIRQFEKSISADDILIATFWDGIAYAYYAREDHSEELEATMGNERWVDVDYLDKNAFSDLFEKHKNIYALESYSPGPGTILLLDQEALEKRFNRYSVKSKLIRLSEDIEVHDFMIGEKTHFYFLGREDDDSAVQDETK